VERFALGHGAGADWGSAAGAALDGFAPSDTANLGFVYVTHELGDDLENILDRLKGETSVTNWVGATGIGICASGHEYFDQAAVAILAGSFPAGSFAFFDTEGEAAEPEPQGPREGLALVHGDPGGRDVLKLVPQVANATESFLVGGLSSPEAAETQVAGSVTGGGLSGVLFSTGVVAATGLSQGCNPIGPVRTITEYRDNIAITIDGRPALEVFREDIGEELAGDLRRAGGVIFAALPVLGSDIADYLVRNLTGVDEERKLLGIGALLDDGQTIMFCRRDADAARADLTHMLKGLHGRAGDAPAGGIYCSCVARGPNLFGPDAAELKMIEAEFGDLPLVGFFGSGEISHGRLYTQTGVLTLFL
jgi:small ligand-binding sensory domain FIST